jgi:squalene-hopene/tetraprenyl-beta-curcumene cyclase
MASRNLALLSLAQALFIPIFPTPAPAGEDTPRPWNRAAAAHYMDLRGEEWLNFASARRGQGTSASTCVSCHSLLPYALARPGLRRLSDQRAPTRLETRVLEQVRRRVTNWDRLDSAEFQLMYDFDEDKKKESRGTEAVLNALILALDDELERRPKSSNETQKALANLWATQIRHGPQAGSWEWLNFGMEPWEAPASRYMGASLAAIAVGTAGRSGEPERDPAARDGLHALKQYLKRSFDAQSLHNRIWALWAAQKVDGLLTPKQRDHLIQEILAKQQAKGGWNLDSLGDFKHKGVTSDLTAADGYATGLILHVLQLAGVPKETPGVSKGLSWLRANQDPTGAWRALSLNKDRTPESRNPAKAHVGKLMWDAATAFAVLALGH